MILLLSGNEAAARGAWEAGVSLGTGYPGTPSSEILPALHKLGGVRAQWCVNEKVALEVASGASWAGGRVLVTMKHVGLNVASDPLFTLAYTGIRGGVVIAVADDPGMHSSQNEQDSRHYARAAKVPLLEPADSQEARDFTRLAFALSEEFDLPVILRLSTRVSHSRGPVKRLGKVRPRGKMGFVKDPLKYVMIPAYARLRRLSLDRRLARLARRAETLACNRVEEGEQKAIITSGIAYQYCREVNPAAACLKLGLVHPLPERMIRDFCRCHRSVTVVEELDPFLETEIKSLGLKIKGKAESFRAGELNPDRVKNILLGRPDSFPPPRSLPPRPPVLCPGCPHRAVYIVLKKLRLIVTGDIGCYTLGTLSPLNALDTCLCMGAGIGQMEGLRALLPPEQRKKVVAVIGDSTFVHSGITGLIDVVYNGWGGVVIILDNQTTAMTGHQHHPATGRSLEGEPAPRLDLEEICRASGVKRVEVISSYDGSCLEAFLKDSLGRDEPSVLIARAPCVLLFKGSLSTVHQVELDLCRACGRCLECGCPALSRLSDGKVEINPRLCRGCSVCAKLCPFGAIHKRSEK